MARFTQEQRDTWLDVAQDVGPAAARKELGYPAERTARLWLHEAGMDIVEAKDQQAGRALQQAFTDAELLSQGRTILTVALEQLEMSPTMDQAVKASLVWGRVIANTRLVQGRSTDNRHVILEELTKEQEDLLAKSQKRNDEVLAALEAA